MVRVRTWTAGAGDGGVDGAPAVVSNCLCIYLPITTACSFALNQPVQTKEELMGLCASTNVSGNAYGNPANSLHRQTHYDRENVTEKAVEGILNAAHRRRFVVHDDTIDVDSSYSIPHFDKTAEKRNMIKTALSKNLFIFNDFTQELREKMIDAMDKQSLQLRDILIKQGDEGDFMYVIESGRLEVLVDDVKVKSIMPGDVVGELALMYSSPRAATVRCVQAPCSVWKVSRQTLQSITQSDSKKVGQHAVDKLNQVELLNGLTTAQKNVIAETLVPMHFKQGAKIINQGDDGHAFYIVDQGSVTCIDRNGATADLTLGVGQYFGELALLNDEKRKRDVVARENTTCLVLGRSDFDSMLGSLKSVMDKNLGLRVLQTVDIFKTLNETTRNTVVDAFIERVFNKGENVVVEGEPGDSFFVVREGTADVSVQKNGKKEVLGALSEGKFFGEGSLLSGAARSATVTATSKSLRVFELKKREFDRHLGEVKKSIARTAEERKKYMAMKEVTLQQILSPKSVIRILGQGTFGLVKLVNPKPGSIFALKVLQKKQIVSYNLAKNIMYEKRMMVESDHPFVLKLVNTYQDAHCLYMLLEIVSGGELFAFLQKRGGFVNTKHAQFITACVVSVFEYIHAKSICYRDLKPENLMIDRDGYIKMVDFGFAKVVTDKTFTLCGTPEYMAPEILLRRGHNKGVDYWATGILIYECESGTTPFADYDNYDNKQICENILRKPLVFPNKMNPAAKLLIQKLLHRQPSKRLGCLARGARDIKVEAYYTSLNWAKLLSKEVTPPYIPEKVGKHGISENAFDRIQVRDNVEKYTGDSSIFKDF